VVNAVAFDGWPTLERSSMARRGLTTEIGSSMSKYVELFVINYGLAKVWLINVTGASEPLLHVHAGLLIFVLAAVLLRRRIGSWTPIALVTLLGVGNEIVDCLGPNPTTARESVIDLANTVFWPAILFAIMWRIR
jgi:hypothetical protein